MQETLMWALTLLTEAFLLSNGILGFFLWRARKNQRRLRAELAEIQRSDPAGVTPASVLAAPPDDSATDAELAETVEARPDTTELSKVVTILDDSSMDESIGRCEETSKTLQQHLEALQIERSLAQQDQQRLAVLRHTVQQMGAELETLRYTHTRIQHDLQNKKLVIKRTMEESDLLYQQRVSLQRTVRELRSANAHLSGDMEIKDRLLQQSKAESQDQQQMRGEVRTLKAKLATREAAVDRLQAEKDALAEEYAVLSKEYERMYASFTK